MKLKAKHWVIKVRVPANNWQGKPTIEYGRPTGGPPYQFINEELARNAAQLWGDAYTRGDVWVEAEDGKVR